MTSYAPILHNWEDKLDVFLPFNECEVLTHAGKLRANVAEKMALEQAERQLEGKGRGKTK